MAIKAQTPSPALVVACIALVIALGTAGYAANTVFSTDIVDGQVKAADIGADAVTSAKVVNNSLSGIDILNNSLTTFDLKGADVNGARISLGAGFASNGTCRDVPLAVVGARAGEAVLISIQAAIPAGVLIYGVRVPSTNAVTMKVCNLSGGAMPAIVDLPIRVITFG